MIEIQYLPIYIILTTMLLNIIKIMFVLSVMFHPYSINGYDLSKVYTVSFGVKISPTPTGGITQYALIYLQRSKVISIQNITLERLINIASGKWPIPNTYIFVDYFSKFQLKDDTLNNGEIIPFLSAFDSLWKIRYLFHPYTSGLDKGWGNGHDKPSLQQIQYLSKRYHIRQLDYSYIKDSAFFQLLDDVQNNKWIQYYKGL